MNVLLAIVIYCGVCYTWGDNYFSNEDAKWGYNFNEAGHKLGFEDGDKFVTIDGDRSATSTRYSIRCSSPKASGRSSSSAAGSTWS